MNHLFGWNLDPAEAGVLTEQDLLDFIDLLEANVSDRTCPAPDCQIQLPRHLFACRRHWWSLPVSMRTRINRAWKAKAMSELARAQKEAKAFLDERFG